MKLTSEIIQNNLQKLESMKKDFPILELYSNETDQLKLKSLYSEGRSYGLLVYLSFIDFIRDTIQNNQQVFYSKKIKIKEFQEVLVNYAIDPKVKLILKSKGKISFQKLINSPKWDLLSGNKRRRGGYRYHDNFLHSSPIIANFCIQNEIELDNPNRISEWYLRNLPEVDLSLKKEIELTNQVIKFMFTSLEQQNYDFKRINIDNLKYFINNQIESKMKEILEGESVRLIDGVDYYSGLSINKVYNVISKDLISGRLHVSIKNDLGFSKSYPYRIFETVTNLRNIVLDELLDL